jgi:hypothetical protein
MPRNIGTHIENRRLLEVAAGWQKLQESEQQHLHSCEVCQAVLYVFVNQPLPLSKNSGKPPTAA